MFNLCWSTPSQPVKLKFATCSGALCINSLAIGRPLLSVTFGKNKLHVLPSLWYMFHPNKAIYLLETRLSGFLFLVVYLPIIFFIVFNGPAKKYHAQQEQTEEEEDWPV